jgi:purine-binding chemotaxis protein CheW
VQEPSQTVVLLRCGQVPFAINALAVHATLPDPLIQPSPLARGHCRGVVDHGGTLVPAVDLQSLCGLGAMPEGPCQGFMVAWPEGMVAFLVTAVLDVIQVPPDACMPVPAFALPRAELMHLALSLDKQTPARMADLGMEGAQFLLLDTEALMRCEEVCNLAQANARQSGVSVDTRSFMQGLRADGLQRPMLTYSLNRETATPLEQVQEILPYSSSVSIFRSNGPLLGFTTHRGQSIPILCLSRLSGGHSPTEVTPAASILIVQSEGELVGFAVPHLKSIEAANWEPEVPRMGQAAEGAALARKLARVGTGSEERMLPVMDLLQLARLVRDREIGVMAA